MNVTDEKSSFIWRLQTADYHARLPINYDGWIRSEPTNAGGYEYCLILTQTFNYFWIDIGCAYEFVSVCEIDIA